MKQQSIMTLAKDMRFEGYVLVRMSEQRTGNTGNKYLDLTLADCTGELNGKLWDGNTDPPPVGSVIKVRGITLEYNGRLQIRIEKLRPLEDSDKVDMSLLTPSAPESPEAMLSQLNSAIESISSQPLRSIVQGMVDLYQDKLPYFPAAQRIHHAERGGLLHHTLGMLQLAHAVLPIYPQLNADLLISGVIIHDLCKMEELDSDELGVVKDYTAAGLLLGHISIGVSRLNEVADKLGIKGEPLLLLQHMLLSHHGEDMYGSPRKPMFPEAEVLHWLDILDARMNEIGTALAKVPPGVFSEKIWSLERRLYQPQYDQLEQE
ncbi:MAG: HD domain-containing protein [Firmicutes bacterium]|nr:HD domain-containing protein [Bacillota bacterium]